jgi:hypothetical protein
MIDRKKAREDAEECDWAADPAVVVGLCDDCDKLEQDCVKWESEAKASHAEIEILEEELESKQNTIDAYFKRIHAAETKLRLMQKREFNFHYTELSKRIKVLWVQDLTGKVDAGQFAKLRYELQRKLDAELVILTSGSVMLWDMTDEELNRLGLARIAPGVIMAPETPNPLEFKPLLEDKDGGSKVNPSD